MRATICSVQRTFDELVVEAESVSVAGWDFSWLNGRATEERPSWGYQRLLRDRLAQVSSALDIHTGGGEVLAGAAHFLRRWRPPNRGRPTSHWLLGCCTRWG